MGETRRFQPFASQPLAGGMRCLPDRRSGHQVRLRTNLVENFADVLVEQAMPRRERGEVITGTG